MRYEQFVGKNRCIRENLKIAPKLPELQTIGKALARNTTLRRVLCVRHANHYPTPINAAGV